jgi:site-specific recombinase XerC
VFSPTEIGLLIRAAPTRRILIEIGYAGVLRASELVALSWADVIEHQDGKVQLDVLGKGGKRRQLLLPDAVGRSLLSLRSQAGSDDPVSARARAAVVSPSAPSTTCSSLTIWKR